MSAAPALAARGLAAGYAGMAAVRGLELEVGAGELVALLGANGAGKTTTVLALAGALAPMAGSVEVGGVATRAPLHQRVRTGTALVTDDRTVFMELTVAENLRVGGVAPAAALALFPELEPHLGRRVGLLSGGQQQMLSLGRALGSEPRILLVDELSLGLAPAIVERLLGAVRAAADRGVAVLVVEQFARSALAVADRALVLSRGEAALAGSGEELLNRIDEVEETYLAA
ncbi:MAG: ATP-binding cassette domain-containing protein [Actinobacteria bacterium]|nr:ATP-binding cassette domain-containing protein [Actinomycetota bacterium]